MADDAISTVIWKDIPGYEGIYEVSSHGRVRNRFGVVLRRRIKWNGYDEAALNKNGKATPFKVHRLVCAAFIGQCPDKHEVNHIDGNRQNNCVENLEYVTRSQNQLHRRVTGTSACGERNANSKLKSKDVIEIRRLRKQGVKRKTLASRYRVSVYLITKITNRNSWTHL